MIVDRPAFVLLLVGVVLWAAAVVLYLLRDGGLYVLGYLGCGLFGGLALLAALVLTLYHPGRRP